MRKEISSPADQMHEIWETLGTRDMSNGGNSGTDGTFPEFRPPIRTVFHRFELLELNILSRRPPIFPVFTSHHKYRDIVKAAEQAFRPDVHESNAQQNQNWSGDAANVVHCDSLLFFAAVHSPSSPSSLSRGSENSSLYFSLQSLISSSRSSSDTGTP